MSAQMMQYDANKKSAPVAYLLWFFVGTLGAHRFYLERTGSAIAILLITVASLLLMFVAVGFFTILIVVIWCFVDIFLIPGMVREYNSRLAERLEIGQNP